MKFGLGLVCSPFWVMKCKVLCVYPAALSVCVLNVSYRNWEAGSWVINIKFKIYR